MTKYTFALLTSVSLLVAGAALIEACSDSDPTAASTTPPATDASFAEAGAFDAASVVVASGCRSDDDCPTFALALCSITTTGDTAVGTCVPDPNEKDANTPCDAGCGRYQNCGYRISDGCSAVLEYCFDLPYKVGGSDIESIACGCDGGDVGYGPGNGFDDQHVPSPVVGAKFSCADLARLDAGDAD